ncbi:MAG: hypothetical protein Q9171_002484 [Xanthocarpia ochracea]
MSALKDARGRRATFEDFPVSLQEFDQAWNDICALEVNGRAFRPSSAVLWKVWRSVIAACTLKGLSLDQALDFSSLASTVEEEDVPPFILKAVVERLRAEGEVPFRECLSLDPARSVQWVGIVLLEARTGHGSAINVGDFISDWKDQLPESWRQYATIKALKENFTQPSDDTVMFIESGLDAGKGASSVAAGKVTGPQARKWHERLKNTRR